MVGECDGPASAGTGSSAPGRATREALAADRAALAIRAALDRLSAALARSAAAFCSLRAWHDFGFARLDDHARERFGRSGRWLRDLAALGVGLASAPQLAEALAGRDGGRPLGRVAATLVARAAPLGNIEEWIRLARTVSVRDLREAIRAAREARQRGDVAAAATGAGLAEAAAAGAGLARPAAAAAGLARPAAAAAGLAGAATAAPQDDLDDGVDRVLARIPVPFPIAVAFEEALDLFRAVEGRQATVTAFLEALVGEARGARPEGWAGFVAPLQHGPADAVVEAALRRATSAWSALPAADSEAAGALASAARFSSLEKNAGEGDAAALDRQISAFVAVENELESWLGGLLAAMHERGDWSALMFAGVGHYAEERLGLSRSRAGERSRLARALRGRPRVARACAAGRISMEAAALIHRMLGDEEVGDETEAAWVEHAEVATIKRMRDEARAAGLYRSRAWACRPPVPPAPCSDERWAASLRRSPGDAIRSVLALGVRAAGLSMPVEPMDAEPDVFHRGEPDARLAGEPDVFHAEGRGTGDVPGHGDCAVVRFTPSADAALPMEPDVFLRLRLPADLATDLMEAIEAARADLQSRVMSCPWDGDWVADGPPSLWIARIAFVRGRRVPLWAGLLALLEEFVATWDTDAGAPERRDDTIFVRDGWRCAAPGCSSRRNLEIHHIVYRSNDGSDDGWNLITLCRFHHQRGEHGTLMTVRGRAPCGLVWRLGRPEVAVGYANERRCVSGLTGPVSGLSA